MTTEVRKVEEREETNRVAEREREREGGLRKHTT